MSDAALQLAFSGMAPDRVDRIIERIGGVEDTVDFIVSGRSGLSAKIEEAVSVPAGRRREELVELGVTFSTESLPGMAAIPGSPRWVFMKGMLPPGQRVAVIGSRRASAYGMAVASQMGSALGGDGRVVVSGLARGVDAAAHRGMVASGGRGIVVLGSGIDVWYPRQNRILGEQILDGGGCVISEFPPGTIPEAWRFPCRNRIIAGLSPVVVVAEAAVRSGALITARLAIELGCEVFALPGDIDRPTSEGCNLLIRDGAFPVTSIQEMCEAIDSVMGPVRKARVPDALLLWGVIGPVPMTLDDIVSTTGRPTGEVLVEVARLEASGEIVFERGMISLAPSLPPKGAISTIVATGGIDRHHCGNGTD